MSERKNAILQKIRSKMSQVPRQEDILGEKAENIEVQNNRPLSNYMTQLFQFLDTDADKYEVEVSFGIVNPGGGFTSYRAPESFNHLREKLNNSDRFEKSELRTYLVRSFNGTKIRSIVDGDETSYQKKIRNRDDVYDDGLYGVRLTKSEETIPNTPGEINSFREEFSNAEDKVWEIITAGKWDGKFPLFTLRYISRYTFMSTDGLVAIDLSHVKEEKALLTSTIAAQKNTFFNTVYKTEIEIERKSNNLPPQKMIEYIEYVLELLNETTNMTNVLTQPQKSVIVNSFNDLFNKKKKGYLEMYSNFWNKPVNLKLNVMGGPPLNIFTEEKVDVFDPAVTVKLNGVRRFLFLHQGDVYCVWPRFYVVKIGKCSPRASGTLIDTEKMTSEDGISTYHSFDILFENGKDIRHLSLAMRLNSLHNIVEKSHIQLFNDAKITVKKFYMETSREGILTYQNINAAYTELEGYDEKDTDGLIMQYRGPYYNNHTYKWKPADQMTIDFRMQLFANEDYERNNIPEEDRETFNYYYICVKDRSGSEVPFVVKSKNDPRKRYDGYAKVEKGAYGPAQLIDGKIIECDYDYDLGSFQPLRSRHDRDSPNRYDVAIDVWNDIMNPLSMSTLLGKDVRLMRKYHNNAKTKILFEMFPEKGASIVDCGSGRGGDIKKWSTLQLNKVYVVEPNKDNLAILNERLETSFPNLKTQIIQLNTGIEDTSTIEEAIGKSKLDGITAFFSLNFIPESDEKYLKFLETLKLIPVGGRFAGIVLDGDRVERLLTERILPTEEEMIASRVNYELSIEDIEAKQQRIEKLRQEAKKLDRKINTLAPTGQYKMIGTDEVYGKPFAEEEEAVAKKRTNLVNNRTKILEEISDLQKEINVPTSALPTGRTSFKTIDMGAWSITPKDIVPGRHIGNEILISINDEDAMVKEQTEYLFYTERFKSDIRSLGFEMIGNGVLNQGPNYMMLPEQSKKLSSLYSFFTYYRKTTETTQVSKLPIIQRPGLVPGYSANLPLDIPADVKYIVAPNQYTFANAVLMAIKPTILNLLKTKFSKKMSDEEYRLLLEGEYKMQEPTIVSSTRDFIEEVASTVDNKLFKKLNGGKLSKKLDIKEYIDLLQNPYDVGEELAADVISRYIEKNIYVITPGRVEKNNREIYTGLHTTMCTTQRLGKTQRYDESVILFTFDNIRYATVYVSSSEKAEKKEMSAEEKYIKAILTNAKNKNKTDKQILKLVKDKLKNENVPATYSDKKILAARTNVSKLGKVKTVALENKFMFDKNDEIVKYLNSINKV